MKRRLALAAVAALCVLLTAPSVGATILPPPPALPKPPAELQPLLDLLAGPGGMVTEPGCATLGTVLGLGTLVIPGLPGTIETQTGIPLSKLPIELQPELLSLANTLLFVQGSGCGLLPLAAERTMCASDDDIALALKGVRARLNLPGLPVQVGDFVPVPAPAAGGVVDMFRTLAKFGVPGAKEVVAALNNAADCEVRTRFTNVVPPPVPPTPIAASPLMPPVNSELRPVDASLGGSGPPVDNQGEVLAAPRATATVTSPAAAAESVPLWFQGLFVLALVGFLYRVLTPSREPLS